MSNHKLSIFYPLNGSGPVMFSRIGGDSDAVYKVGDMLLLAANNRADELSAELQKANAEIAALREAVRAYDKSYECEAYHGDCGCALPSLFVLRARPVVAEAMKGEDHE